MYAKVIIIVQCRIRLNKKIVILISCFSLFIWPSVKGRRSEYEKLVPIGEKYKIIKVTN